MCPDTSPDRRVSADCPEMSGLGHFLYFFRIFHFFCYKSHSKSSSNFYKILK